MDMTFYMLTIVVWVVFVIILFITIGKFKKSSSDEESEDILNNEDEIFKELLDDIPDKDSKFGEMMLKESRDNLDYSLSQRNYLNDSNFSMTALIIGLVSGAVFLGKYLFEIKNESVQHFFGSLIVMIFICISISVFLLLRSFFLKYSNPEPKDKRIRKLMEEAKKGYEAKAEDGQKKIREIRNYLITLNGHKSAENYAANNKKFELGKCTRMYIFSSSVILLAMLVTLAICKLCDVLNTCGCCC